MKIRDWIDSIGWLKKLLFRDGYRSVSMTLRPGAMMTAGDLRIHPIADGRLMIVGGADLAVVATPQGDGTVHLQCHASGDRHPKLVDAEAGPAPLCRFGPGGDYVADHSTDIIGADAEAPANREVATA